MSLDYSFPERLDAGVINDASVSAESLDASLNPGEELFGEGEWPSLRGLWRVDHRTTLRSELPVILQEVETVVDAVLIAEVTQEDELLWLHYRVCDVRMESDPAFNHTILPDAFLEGLPVRTRRASLELLTDGWTLDVPRQYELRGVASDFPLDSPLPMTSDDPYIFDQDRDGAPGLTARLVGFPEGEVSLIQRSWDAWRGRLTLSRREVTEIKGSIEWGDEQRIIEASSDVFKVDVRRWIPEDASLHRFQMRRIDQLVCPPRREPPTPDR